MKNLPVTQWDGTYVWMLTVVVVVNAQALGGISFTLYCFDIISQLMKHSQNLELWSEGDDSDSLWSSLLCTRCTLGMDRLTAWARGPWNKHG
jgi:hypothetical protein